MNRAAGKHSLLRRLYFNTGRMSAVNNPCIRCGAPAARTVRALEVRTLHVRSLSGEKRVQALGDELERGVCEHCARESLDLSMHPLQAIRKQLICFGAVFAAGVVLAVAAFLLWGGQRVFMLVGIAAMACGILGVIEAVKNAREKDRTLRALPESEALEEAAWDVFTAEAPKKEGDNDLTYIPVNEKTLQRKNGDLMVLYRLLPGIAVEAWNRLHHKDNGSGSSDLTRERKETNDPPYCNVQDQG